MRLLQLWIWLNVVLVAGGWILSLFHALNAAGYAGLLVVAVIGGYWVGFRGASRHPLRLPRWRLRQTLPRLFLALLLLCLVRGAADRPESTDGLAYRTPRVLDWLQNGSWEWMPTNDDRKNNRGTGFEWMTAPLLLFTRTDRAIYLINMASFALLPGMLFSFLRGRGLGGRTAWSWSWVLASGTGCVLQAPSISSDLPSVPLLLGAVVLAQRAAKNERWRDLGFSILAAALPTGQKPFNTLLLLPWLTALWPARHLLWRHAGKVAALLPIAALCSLLPMALLNQHFAGHWSGLRFRPETGVRELNPVSPGIGFLGNACLLISQNLLPPFVPGSLQSHLEPLAKTPLGVKLNHSFEGIFFDLPGGESGSTAGIGLGIVVLLFASAWAGRRTPAPAHAVPIETRLGDAGSWFGLLVFMLKAGAQQAGRLALPFYPFLLAPILRRPCFAVAVRRPWWRWASALVVLYPPSLFLIDRTNSLVPWETGIRLMSHLQPAKPLWPKALGALDAHRQRADLFAGMRAVMPASERRIGLIGNVVKEATLWLPFGSRWMVDVVPGQTPQDLTRTGIHYVVMPSAETTALAPLVKDERDALEKESNVVSHIWLPATLTQPAEEWLLVRLPEAP